MGLFVTLMVIIGLGGVLNMIFIAAGSLIFNTGYDLSDFVSGFRSKDLSFLRFLIVAQDLSVFIIPSLVILRLFEGGIRSTGIEVPEMRSFVLTIVLAICLFPITGLTKSLNDLLDLPSWLSGMEQWMTEKEKTLDDISVSLLASASGWAMLLNIVTIAVIPAASEELLFRGVLQRVFGNLFKSDNIAVWITAFLFSAIHLQFYGFLPRFILGLVYGYLYLRSGNIILPVIAHFINNAAAVVLAHFSGSISYASGINLWEQTIAAMAAAVVVIMIFRYFRSRFNQG
jgi:uncharacterized protein